MRRAALRLFAVILGCASVLCSCKKTEQGQQSNPAVVPPGAASSGAAPTTSPSTGAEPPRLLLPADAPHPVRLALAGDAGDGIERRMTSGWSSGKVAFDFDRAVYTIARDYDQVLAVQVRNLSEQPQKVLALLADFGGGLIGDFAGDGAVRPLELPPGKSATLALHLFAQDAARTNYRSTVILKDAQTHVVLAAAPITVFVARPNFSLRVTMGEQDPATLARTVTVHNDGETLTDFAVKPGGPLAGRAVIKPVQEHVHLAAGADQTFRVVPILDTAFAGASGQIVLSGAGQEQRADVSLPMPAGKHVFVASSFSTSDNQASGTYCTNNPNTNTPVNGPNGAPSDPDDSGKNPDGDNNGPWQKFKNWVNNHGWPIPGLPVDTKGRYGFPGGSVGVPQGGIDTGVVDIQYGGKVGPYGVEGTATVGMNKNNPSVESTNNVNTPQGRQLNQLDQDATPTGGAHDRPRGLLVRPMYAAFRPGIYHDNHAEAFCDVGPGDAATRFILETWHSNRWTDGKGIQVLLRVWDGLGQRALTRPIAMSSPAEFSQWPTVLALPGGDALVVWETAPAKNGPPTLAYRFGRNAFQSWTKATALPGADSPAGNYDPQAILTSDGQALIVWQQGRERQARLMLARCDAHGVFTAVTPVGLPAGAARPVARFTSTRSLCLIFQSPPQAAEAGVDAAVYAAISHNGGASFASVHRLSPANADAGEADLLVHGKRTDVALRVGPSGASSIACIRSDDGGETWSEPKSVTSDALYAEYPTLGAAADGMRLSFYGDLRANRALTPAGAMLAGAAGDVTAAPNAQNTTALKRFAMDQTANGDWSPQRRILTEFPVLQAAWLEVNFKLNFARRDYSPHEVSVLLNDVVLMHQTNVIPEGTYLLPFSPAILLHDADGRPSNVIGLRTLHMNPGHYQTAANFRLQARHAFMERLIVASTQEEADALAAVETSDVNHARPDVGLFARPAMTATMLPATPEIGQIITLPLTVGNLGETAAGNVRIHVYAGTPHVGQPFKDPPVGKEIDLGTLAPLDLKDVDVKFPFGGAPMYCAMVSSDAGDPTQPESARAAIPPARRDFDLSNNIFQVSFVLPRAPSITPRAPGDSPDLMADLDDDPAPPQGWRVLDEKSGKEIAHLSGDGRASVPIPPGRYKLALTRFLYEGQELTFPAIVEKKPDKPIEANVHSAIEIELPPWNRWIYSWKAVEADHPEHIVQSLYGRHPVMLLPPGDYRVAILPTQYESAWVTWPQRVHLEAGQHQTLKLDSGVMPPESLASVPPPYSWVLWPQGKTDGSVAQSVRTAWTAACVPPGKYQWGIRLSQYNTNTVIFPEVLNVEPGKLLRPQSPGALTFVPSSWSGVPFYLNVLDAKSGRVVQGISSGAALTSLLPPGEYRVNITPFQYNSMDVTLLESVKVQSGQSVKVLLNTGLDVQPAKTGRPEPPPYRFAFTREGDEKPTQSIIGANWGPALLPAGRYHVTLSRNQYGSRDIVWPTLVQVAPGELAKLSINSGIHLTEMTKEQAKSLSFQILSLPAPASATTQAATAPAPPPATPTVVQTGNASVAAQTQWLPPGTYCVQIQDNVGAWQTAADNVQVPAGRVVDVKITGPASGAPPNGGAGIRRN